MAKTTKNSRFFYPALALALVVIVGASGYYIYRQNNSGAATKQPTSTLAISMIGDPSVTVPRPGKVPNKKTFDKTPHLLVIPTAKDSFCNTGAKKPIKIKKDEQRTFKKNYQQVTCSYGRYKVALIEGDKYLKSFACADTDPRTNTVRAPAFKSVTFPQKQPRPLKLPIVVDPTSC